MPRTSHLPKRELVRLLSEVYTDRELRELFHFKETTEVAPRLNSFAKIELVAALIAVPKGEVRLANIERSYPLYGPPTLYLVNVTSRPNREELLDRSSRLSRRGLRGAIDFGEGEPIRRVYVTAQANENQEALEISLNYERRIEFVQPDPADDDFGVKTYIYSLDRGLIWIPEMEGYGIVVCRDMPAFKSILEFGKQRLDISWYPPNIPQSVLDRLVAGSRVRSATFYTRDPDTSDIDVQSLSFSDPDLSDRQVFDQTVNDAAREQTSGFYNSHPGLADGGLGVSTQYGKVWTPRHLGREELSRLGSVILERIRSEIRREREQDRRSFVSFYQNRPVKIADKPLVGKNRKYFDILATYILDANANDREVLISRQFLTSSLKVGSRLGLYSFLEFDCPNCGVSIARSATTHNPYTVTFVDDLLLVAPENEPEMQLGQHGRFVCECGEEIDYADIYNHIRILPSIEFLSSMLTFLNGMEGIQLDILFSIAGERLRIVARPEVIAPTEVKIDDLDEWRKHALIHRRKVPAKRSRQIYSNLRHIKEKCRRDGGRPQQATCHACVLADVPSARLEDQNDICLPRIMGLAIGKNFDGIHHGHEGADIKYVDHIRSENRDVNVGLHLKSAVKQEPPQGVGRTKSQIKGLFTQLTYSAYQAATGAQPFSLLGVSIPNLFKPDVREALVHTATGLGFSILVLDKNDWVRIYEAAEDNTADL